MLNGNPASACEREKSAQNTKGPKIVSFGPPCYWVMSDSSNPAECQKPRSRRIENAANAPYDSSEISRFSASD